MNWFKKANEVDISSLEELLKNISLGIIQLNDAAYSLTPMCCDLMNSMLLSHPQYVPILNKLIGAVCSSEKTNEIGTPPVYNEEENSQDTLEI